MKLETMIWTLLFLAGGSFLLARAMFTEHGYGKVYVKAVEHAYAELPEVEALGGDPNKTTWINLNSDDVLDYEPQQIQQAPTIQWTEYQAAQPKDYWQAEAKDPNQNTYRFSLTRTIGLWAAAFFTLAIFSFLYKDNPLYKIAEAVVVGVSAAYWMVVGFWDTIVPNLIAKLAPHAMQAWSLPGLSGGDLVPSYIYLLPLLLGILLLMRLSPAGGWISRWPLAFIIGTTAGLRLIAYIHGDFLAQIRNSIVPLVVISDVPGEGFLLGQSIENTILVIGILACLVYFFFSFEHKGIVGKTAKVGIWFLMITFGAAFGFTVMGRIALLAIRLEFLFDDWLWLIDPIGRRTMETAAAMVMNWQIPMLL